jgi:aminopeptidase
MAFTAKQLENYAEVMIWGLWTARPKYRPNDLINIRIDSAALPLAEALHRKLIQRKMNVVIRTQGSPNIERDFYLHSESRQRRFIAPGEKEFAAGLHGLIVLLAPESLTHLRGIDPKRIGEVAVARKPVRDVLDRREEKGLFGWTLCLYPTPEPAKTARLSLAQYQAQIVKACFLDAPDPVARWEKIHRESEDLKKWLNGLPIETLHLESASADLEISQGARRQYLGGGGNNIPSFEIFTSPDWRGTRGVFYADLPSYRSGNYVEGLRVEFSGGKAVRVSAKKGEEFARKMLGLDAGAGRIGEFSLTDCRFSKIDRFMANTLFDENFGGRFGNCHIALGASYSNTFKGNPARLTPALKKELGFNDSSIHWDIINTEDKVVTAKLRGGKKVRIYEKGRFQH